MVSPAYCATPRYCCHWSYSSARDYGGWNWMHGTSAHGDRPSQDGASGTLLPGYYTYPSFDYWLNLLVLAPDAVASPAAEENLREHLLRALDSPAYLLRLRAVYLLITSLSLVWVYLLVLQLRGSWLEALFAASLLACSWEVAYHLRWVATDGMLMQFAALTGLLAVHALKSRRDSWLMAAAAVAGLGCGTKYPGGLLVLPVVLAGFFGAPGCTPREKAVRFMKVATVFALVYLAVTPGTILQPLKFAHGVLYELTHYATGHGGHTVGRGLEHMQRLLMYFATVLFSPYLPYRASHVCSRDYRDCRRDCAGLASGSSVRGLSISLHAILLNAGNDGCPQSFGGGSVLGGCRGSWSGYGRRVSRTQSL